ncbi:MAG: hypothetical protein FD134_1281 [Gallionellaceae bacterium]|nr:MAG: hypothetical protein FD134_1281 [Gallionellaceae bacterium]
MRTLMPTEEEVRASLSNVIDPEVGMNIVDLGLVYVVKITDNTLRVDITMTTQACPMTDMILSDASLALETLLPDNAQIELNLVWEPPWTPAMMTKCARHHFGWDEPSDRLV